MQDIAGLNPELVQVVRDTIAKERARPAPENDEKNVQINATSVVYVYCCEHGWLEEPSFLNLNIRPGLTLDDATNQIGDMEPYLAGIRAIVKQCMQE